MNILVSTRSSGAGVFVNKLVLGTFTVAALIFSACTPPTDSGPTSSIRISVTGQSARPVTIDWTIHSHSGSSSLRLDHGSSDPWTKGYRDIAGGTYGTVTVTIQNSDGNQSLSSGDGSSVTASLGTEKTLDLTNGGLPVDLSGVSVDDVFVDNSGDLLYITEVQNSTPPHQVTVQDTENNFDTGNWEIFADNTTYFSVWIERDGQVIGPPKVFATRTGDVDFSYGSAAW